MIARPIPFAIAVTALLQELPHEVPHESPHEFIMAPRVYQRIRYR